MSEDATISILKSQIAELTSRLTKAAGQAKERKVALEKLQTRIAQMESEHKAALEAKDAELAELQEAVVALDDEREEIQHRLETTPDEMRAEVDRLTGELRVRDVRDKFSDLKEKLQDGVKLDQLFKYVDFDPGSVEDPASLDVEGMVKQWQEAASPLFKQAENRPEGAVAPKREQAAPLKVADGLPGRGARDTASSRVTYTKAEIRRPGWERTRPELRDAIESGEAVCLDA